MLGRKHEEQYLAKNSVQLSILLGSTIGAGSLVLAFDQGTTLPSNPLATIWICSF